MEKLMIVHSDGLLSRPQTINSFKRVEQNIRSLLEKAQLEGRTVERIDKSNQVPNLGADVYVIGDDVSARRALEVIQPGDEIRVAGLYKDVCVSKVAESAKEMGANSQIVEEATIEMDPDKWV